MKKQKAKFHLASISGRGFSSRSHLDHDFWLRSLLLILIVGSFSDFCRASELSTAQKQALLAKVKRVAIVSPYFGIPARLGPEPDVAPKKEKEPPKQTDAQIRQQKHYLDSMLKLETDAQEHLPLRFAARTSFLPVPPGEVEDALKALSFTPQSLYQNNGRMRGTRFPPPDAEAVRKLAAQSKADAVLLAVLDEPRRTNGRILFDPLNGLQGDPPDVRSKAGFYLLMADGTEVLHAFVEVLHPVTHGTGGKDYLLVDWMEAQNTVIEDFMDELTRYTPEK